MIGLEHDRQRRRSRVEPLPDVASVRGWRERIEDGHLAARLDARRRDLRLPLDAGPPVRMLETPDPETGRHVADVDGHRSGWVVHVEAAARLAAEVACLHVASEQR